MDELVLQVRAQIARYLAGDADVRALHQWMGPTAWETEHCASTEAAELIRTAQLYLSEFAHGDFDEHELSSHLRGVLGVIGDWEPTQLLAGSASRTIVCDLPLVVRHSSFTAAEWTPAGRGFEKAFA